MYIRFVKKILSDGTFCPKCEDVSRRLEADGHIARIDEVIIADARDPNSAGVKLAATLNVSKAPFFVVSETSDLNDPAANVRVYTVFFRFLKEVLAQSESTEDTLSAAREIQRAHPELDFL